MVASLSLCAVRITRDWHARLSLSTEAPAAKGVHVVKDHHRARTANLQRAEHQQEGKRKAMARPPERGVLGDHPILCAAGAVPPEFGGGLGANPFRPTGSGSVRTGFREQSTLPPASGNSLRRHRWDCRVCRAGKSSTTLPVLQRKTCLKYFRQILDGMPARDLNSRAARLRLSAGSFNAAFTPSANSSAVSPK